MKRIWAIVAMMLGIASADAGSMRVDVLVGGNVANWGEHHFVGDTDYRPVSTEIGRVLQARSDASASGMYRRIRIDLEKTPILRWRWRAESTFGAVDETTKAGDDYPVRVGVVAVHPVLFWDARVVNYVWASNRPKHSIWVNAFTDRARMVAVRSGDAELGQWVEEVRNVRDDFRRLFGEDVRYVDIVGVMTDTDGTGQTVTGYYGDIYFTEG